MSSESVWGKISDIAEINPETTNSNWNGREILYIDIASVGCGVFNSEPQLMMYDEAPSRARRVVKHGDVLISTVRPNRRSMIQILNPAENTVASTGFALIRPKRIEDSDYLFGIICNKQFTLELEMLAYGAAYPAVSTDDICRPNVYLPEEEERDTISRFLRPISKFNQFKLQEIMHEYISELFRSWFINYNPVKVKAEGKLPYGMDDETAAMFPNSFEDSELGPIPSGWRVSSISEICKMSSGGTPSRSKDEYFSAPDTGYPWLASREINWSIVHKAQEHISEIGLKNSSAKLFPENTTVMAMYGGGTVGRCGFLGSPMTTSQAVCAMMAKDKLCLPIYLYSLIKSESERIVWKYAVGGAQVNLSQQSIGKHLIVLPPFEIIQKFESEVDELFANIDTSSIQSEKLSEIRDALLPRLMSGELEV